MGSHAWCCYCKYFKSTEVGQGRVRKDVGCEVIHKYIPVKQSIKSVLLSVFLFGSDWSFLLSGESLNGVITSSYE